MLATDSWQDGRAAFQRWISAIQPSATLTRECWLQHKQTVNLANLLLYRGKIAAYYVRNAYRRRGQGGGGNGGSFAWLNRSTVRAVGARRLFEQARVRWGAKALLRRVCLQTLPVAFSHDASQGLKKKHSHEQARARSPRVAITTQHGVCFTELIDTSSAHFTPSAHLSLSPHSLSPSFLPPSLPSTPSFFSLLCVQCSAGMHLQLSLST